MAVQCRGGMTLNFSSCENNSEENISLNLSMKSGTVANIQFTREQFQEFVDFVRNISESRVLY